MYQNLYLDLRVDSWHLAVGNDSSVARSIALNAQFVLLSLKFQKKHIFNAYLWNYDISTVL